MFVMNDTHSYTVPVSVDSGLLEFRTATAVNWIVLCIPEHPPHDRIQPRVEEERPKTDVVDRDLVATISSQTQPRIHELPLKQLTTSLARILNEFRTATC